MRMKQWAAVVVLSMVVSAAVRTHAAPPAPADAAVKARVDALLAKMTLDDKIGQLNQAGAIASGRTRRRPRTSCARAAPAPCSGSTTPSGSTRCRRLPSRSARRRSRCCSGSTSSTATARSSRSRSAMAASWDPRVAERAQADRRPRGAGGGRPLDVRADGGRRPRRALGTHRRRRGRGPVPRRRRWRRPRCAASRGRTWARPDRVARLASKHFAAYGAADGGRDYDPVYVSESAARNVYLPPFHGRGEGGRRLVHERLHGPERRAGDGANPCLLRDVLRGRVGLHRASSSATPSASATCRPRDFARDGRDAAARALGAGLDMDMASGTFPQNLAALVKDGASRRRRSTRPCAASSRSRCRLGLFEQPYADEARAAGRGVAGARRAVPRRAAGAALDGAAAQRQAGCCRSRQSLKASPSIGPLADSKDATPRAPGWSSATCRRRSPCSRGIKARLPEREGRRTRPDPRSAAIYLRSSTTSSPARSRRSRPRRQAEAAFKQAVATAKGAEPVIVVLGESADMSGEAASRASLELPGRQQELLERCWRSASPSCWC